MDATSFWKTIDSRIDAAISRSKPYTAKVTSVNSEGVQIRERGSALPLGERFKTLRGLGVSVDDDVVVLPQSNIVIGAVGGEGFVTISSVLGLQSALDGKANSSHTHTIANVTNLQTALDGKSDTSHNHDSAYAAKSSEGRLTYIERAAGERWGTNVYNLAFEPGIVKAYGNNGTLSDVVSLAPDWGFGANQIPQGNLTQQKMQMHVGGGNYANIGWAIAPINGFIATRDNTYDLMYLAPQYGTAAATIAEGNHKHARNNLFNPTHYVTTATVPRHIPSTGGYAYNTVAVSTQLTVLGSQGFTADGFTWWQCYINNVGVVWVKGSEIASL